MFDNVSLEIHRSGDVKPCDKNLEYSRRQTFAVVQFPYCIIIFVFIIFGVCLVCYRQHLERIAKIPLFTAEDFIRDRNQFYSDLYRDRIRNIILRAAAMGRKFITEAGNDGSSAKRLPRKSMMLCPATSSLMNANGKERQASELEATQSDVMTGGMWKPAGCIARHRVAIVIPYRNRKEHLTRLLSTLVPTLKSQNVHFKIYVSEQYGNGTFNKGVLMNAAFLQALQDQDWQCFVFHDVDLVPENITNMYTCPRHPRHMSVAIDQMGYRLPYEHLVGGVFVLRTEHFQQLNGYSNSYWGWGAEDDDMSIRINQTGLRIDRPPYNIARYKMLKHDKRQAAEFRKRYVPLAKAKYRFHIDGLNSVNYKLISKTVQRLYTHLLIDVGSPPR